MSVIVKGMDMPKNCKECMFADFDDVDFDYELYCKANEKYADLDMYDHPMGWDCPLIELPPHGRLIDIKSVEYGKFVTVSNDYQRWWNGALESVIDNAPTVIEAEGSE